MSIQHLPKNPTMEKQNRLVRDIVYSNANGVEIKLSLIKPWSLEDENLPKVKLPLIVFVQGSAWTTPDRDYEIPQLSMFARMGYVVATILHRDCTQGPHPYPAYLADTKCAIRYLRAHAEEYGIDPERVAIWGTSSGGNTSLLVGLTGDDPKFKTEEYAEQSDAVKAVVECFGPTDMPALWDYYKKMAEMIAQKMPDAPKPPEGPSPLVSGLCGGDMSRYEEVMDGMSPVNYVENSPARAAKTPFLLIHGDADPVVPYDQMTSLLAKMEACDYDVDAWCIDGAVHEGNFWSDAVYDVVAAFLKKNL